MKKFENVTINQKEKAIRLGTKVPSDAVNLAWFKSDTVTPSNTLSLIDTSKSIAENVIQQSVDNEAFFAYPNVLGYLHSDEYGYNFPSNDITISNIPLNFPITTEPMDPTLLNPNDFAHYKYISRFFTPSEPNFSFISLGQYLDPDRIVDLNIKVINQDGSEYVDPISARRKYRILLESFRTDQNINKFELPHRIIVLLDADKPVNLKLVYNKIEADENGIMFNQELEYSETINAVPIFSEFPEDSYIVDSNYTHKRVFSIKKHNERYSDLTSGTPINSGFQVLASKKSIKDNRTYEVFNWRLIARSRASVDFDEVNYGIDIDNSGRINIRTVNAGVLYVGSEDTSDTREQSNPYIFKRLQDSPFNLSNYNFVNPLNNNNETSFNSDQSSYWMVNLDEVELSDLLQFDILYFNVNIPVTSSQASKLLQYSQSNGVLIVDIEPSEQSTNYAAAIDPGLTLSSSLHSAESVTLNLDNVLIDYTKNGGWTISSDIFESENYGIHGTNYINISSSYKSYPYFSSVSQQNNMSATIPAGGEEKAIAVSLVRSGTNADAVTSGMIVGTSFGLGDYVNNVVDLSNSDIVTSNYGSSNLDFAARFYSATQEGPFKFLYNIISYGLYLRAQSSRFEDDRSTLYNYVSRWRSSWVMDSAVIRDDELSRYVEVSNEDESTIYAVNLVDGHDNIFEFYKSKLSEFLSDFQSERLSNLDSSDIDFYIEITNQDVDLRNCNRVSNPIVDENIPSSYNLWKIVDPLTNGVMAYTQTYSPSLFIPDTFGPYTIRNDLVSSSNERNLLNTINPLSQFKEYRFDLDSAYTHSVASNEPVEFSAELSASATLEIVGNYYKAAVEDTPEQTETNVSIGNSTIRVINLESAVDEDRLRTSSSSWAENVFPYTGDVDIANGGTNATISSGYRHRYASYIQIFLKAYTLYKNNGTDYYPYSIDGYYGPATASGITKFQREAGERFIDGKVDSETKWYMAKYWGIMKSTLKSNGGWDQVKSMVSSAGVQDFWDAARGTVQAYSLAANDARYRKLSFTGTRGPTETADFLVFEVPPATQTLESYMINKIIITPDSEWNNFTVSHIGYASSRAGAEAYQNSQEVYKDARNGTIEINLGQSHSNARYIWFKVAGRSLPSRYGYAEGFGIRKIRADITTSISETSVTQPFVPGSPEANIPTKVLVDLTLVSDTVPNISIDSNGSKSYNPLNFLSSALDIRVTRIRFYHHSTNALERDYNNLNIPSSDIRNTGSEGYLFRQTGDDIYSVNLKQAASRLNSISFSIEKVYDVMGEEHYDSDVGGTPPVLLAQSSGDNNSYSVVLSTNATFFAGTQVERYVNQISSYKLKSAVSGDVLPQRDTITVLDGVMLFCKDDGTPEGLPSSEDINSGLSIIDDIETDKRYGSFAVINNLVNEDGFIYGFYDNSQKEFIGKKITYLDFIDRGIDNIYIGVCAIDADGNTMGSNEYLGPTVSQTFIPVNIPLRSVYAIFSVKVNTPSSVRVGNIYSSLTKRDCWELPIYSGQFLKNITIPDSANYSDWKNQYVGQQLYCNYDISEDIDTTWSDIYGYGHYDVYNENPVLINEKRIRLRRTPLLVWNHPTTNEGSIVGGMKPVLKIYTKQSVDSEWTEVPYQDVRDVNSFTGVIDFKTRIVPSDPSLIKVDYTTKDKQIYFRQVNGNQIPLNPVLSSDYVSFIDPLYIYILPAQVWKSSNSNDTVSYELVEDYEYTTSVNFTYDSRIFDKTSHLYNPFALKIAIIYTLRNPNNTPAAIEDTRSRGGGVVDGYLNNEKFENIAGLDSAWDVQPPSGHAYPNGGYVVIRIPQEVRNHFTRNYEIYRIISNNLTAGVVYDLQDMEGNPWG